MKARRCKKYAGTGRKKRCIRYKRVSVRTAKGQRQGKQYFKGDRIVRGSWSKRRWRKARNVDKRRIGRKYEKWERNPRMRWK